jgi:hypothetical protein
MKLTLTHSELCLLHGIIARVCEIRDHLPVIEEGRRTYSVELRDNEAFFLHEACANDLVYCGFDADYNATMEGRVLESIIDKITDEDKISDEGKSGKSGTGTDTKLKENGDAGK